MTTTIPTRTEVGRLHVLTDPRGPRPVTEVAEAALGAGAPVIQVRSKSTTDRVTMALIDAVLDRCRAAGATCIVNDRVDLALAAGADGVHLGPDDLPVGAARRLAPHLLIGATVRDETAAAAAVAEGADYLGIGPVHATTTKDVDADPLGEERCARIAASVSVPSVGIAGIDAGVAARLRAAGVHGVAVVGAISRAEDPGRATEDLLAAVTDR